MYTRRARASLARLLLRHELIDVGRYGLVQAVLVAVQSERQRNRMPVRKESVTLNVLQVFFQSSERPGAILAKSKNVTADRGRLIADPVRLRKQIRVEEAQEMSEPILVTVVRCSREEST
jgi:hypothetical protein